MLARLVNFILRPSMTRCVTGPLMVFPRLLRRQAAPRRVLIVRLDRIGDVVLTTPLLRELRSHLPDAFITLIVTPGLVPLMRPCPFVNQVIGYQRTTAGGGRGDLINRFRLIRFAVQNLWTQRFDLAICPRRDWDPPDAAMLAYFSGAPRRIGFTESASELKKQLNRGCNSLFTDVLPAPDAHEVQSNLSVLKHLGFAPASDRLELWNDTTDEEWADGIAAQLPAVKILIGICVGASYIEKQWPAERFIEIVRDLLKDEAVGIVIVGGPTDAAAATQVYQSCGDRVINLTATATLRQTYTILKRCKLYIGNDTGPMHLAVAAGTPVVEICSFAKSLDAWHSNSPNRFGPWGVPSVVLQPDRPAPPCEQLCSTGRPHCILGVQVTDVLSAIHQLR